MWSLRPESISQAFKRVCQVAGIEGLTFHDLRHEATSRLFEKGLEIMEVKTITGHKTLQMLLRYTHI
ncbi:MAG TPA: tyrosine-type recombinase/integrase [Acidiferrobacter sp.]|nr:tyrosine-type recombinase/integrase [Acidiferrobacter sp.]